MRDWDLVLYKYANVSVLGSSAPSVRARTGAFPSAGSMPPGHSHFYLSLSLSVDPFVFDITAVAASFFVIYHVAIPKLCSFSLFYNNSAHYPEVILVWISCPSVRAKCPSSAAMQRLSKSTEILSIRCTLGLISPSSI